MKELMPGNTTLKMQWAESGSSSSSLKLREIEDIFLGILLPVFPSMLSPDKTAKEFIAYAQSIIHLACDKPIQAAVSCRLSPALVTFHQ